MKQIVKIQPESFSSKQASKCVLEGARAANNCYCTYCSFKATAIDVQTNLYILQIRRVFSNLQLTDTLSGQTTISCDEVVGIITYVLQII